MSDLKERVDAESARQMLGRDEANAVDTRSSEQFALGHIPAALNAPDGEIPEDMLDEPLIVVCEDGEESAELAAKLRDDGNEATSIEGGMNAWESANLPLQPSADPLSEDGKAPKLPGAGV